MQRGAEAIAENYKHSLLESKEQYDAMYKQSIEDPERFWSDIAKDFYWKKQVSASECTYTCNHPQVEPAMGQPVSVDNMTLGNVPAVGGQAHQLQL